MTHPITPPPELVSKWCYEDGEEIKSSPRWFYSVCAKAAQWGSDQELEACCEELEYNFMPDSSSLRAARRPRPPSLKERALDGLTRLVATGEFFNDQMKDLDTIRRALEALPE